MSDLAALALRLMHRFADPGLLVEALTHASATNRAGGAGLRSYERLEFLGDRVLGLIVALMVMERFPEEPVGGLARRLAALVQQEGLDIVAREIGLAAHLRLSPGENQAGTRDNAAILADCCEAVIAALYIDGGMEAAERFVRKYWSPLIERDLRPPKDAKTALQEWALGRGLPLPQYETIETKGPDHRPTFIVEASVAGFSSVTASGGTKRIAEQAAARALLDAIERSGAGNRG